ncbi:MAG TPA: hypothetical protein PJ986_14985 [Gammaproteobacteria bacterium]|nr:hypothetical protein [Gammaproteobacteria bacterium]
MADARFDVVFSGQLQAGVDAAQVHENLARLFKTEPAKLAHLFTGQAVPIKRGVDAATALQYQAALAKAGALVELIDTSSAAERPAPAAIPAPAAATRPAVQPARGPREAPVTVPPAMAARGAPPVAPDYSVAEPGVVLVEPAPVPPPAIDTRHLSVAAVGETLVEPTIVAAPAYDLSGLSLDPLGTFLSEAEPVAPAQYDLSKLSLAPS